MEIMFDDLTKEAQKRLLEEVGIDDPEEMGWDVKPVAVVSFDDYEDDDQWDYADDDEDDDEDYGPYDYDDDEDENY